MGADSAHIGDIIGAKFSGNEETMKSLIVADGKWVMIGELDGQIMSW